jgi:hypothetical protein
MKSEKIIDQTMNSLGLKNLKKTNPTLINKILSEMKLNNFKTSHSPMKKFLNDIKTKPQNLNHFFRDIKNGIIIKHPAIIEFLELAHKKKWLKKSKKTIKAVHIAFILEHITAAMCNNDYFFLEMHNYIKERKKELGIEEKHMIKSVYHLFSILHGKLFEILKTISVDPLMIILKPRFKEFKLNKAKIKKIHKNGEINYLEYRLLTQKQGIFSLTELGKINIYEAGITEYKSGFKDNAICAQELCEDLKVNSPTPKIKNSHIFPENTKNDFYKKLSNSKNKFITANVSQKWTSLYETWNLAFILGNMNNLEILFPKLLIPSVINSKPEHYSETRVISLWLSINNYIFWNYDHKNETKGPKNKVMMAKAWGKINKKYALEMAKKETHENSRTLMKHYHEMFSKPVLNLFLIIKKFLHK